ncbi:MAG: YhjD/YihY/BrkB family envelope integrity protein, partial [Candidatus Taylorbacteria bacterium]
MLEKARTSIVYNYVRQLVLQFRQAELTSMSAQITYYLILAFFPFLFFLINLLSFTSLPNRFLLTNFYVLLPNDTAILVKDILQQTVQAKSKTLLLLGMLGSLCAIFQGMCAVIRGLNLSYGVKETRGFIKLHLVALSATICISLMIPLTFFMIVLGRIT